MKIKDGFILNKVGSQYVVVPVGEASMERHCMIRLNDTGAFLWEQLGADTTEDVLVRARCCGVFGQASQCRLA